MGNHKRFFRYCWTVLSFSVGILCHPLISFIAYNDGGGRKRADVREGGRIVFDCLKTDNLLNSYSLKSPFSLNVLFADTGCSQKIVFFPQSTATDPLPLHILLHIKFLMFSMQFYWLNNHDTIATQYWRARQNTNSWYFLTPFLYISIFLGHDVQRSVEMSTITLKGGEWRAG